MNRLASLIFAIFLVAGCSACSKTYVAMDAKTICDVANEKKDVQLSGYLVDGVTVMCSNYGGRMDCSYRLIPSPGEKDGVSVSIEMGNSANTVEKLERGYKKEDIKIRDNAGNLVAADKVKVSGMMSVGPKSDSGQAYFLTVDKIEKW